MTHSQDYKLLLDDSSLNKVGYGIFHVILLLVCGCALSSDAVEVHGIAFVIPVIDDNNSVDSGLHPTKFQSGALDSIVFLGMMIGSYIFGIIADIIGRKPCLITSNTINGIFGLISSLSPNFGTFMFFRFMSGFGVGGSAPVLITYFSEFFPSQHRPLLIIILVSFWSLGMIYTTVLAWLVIPCSISGFHVGTIQVTSWRVFLVLCTIPCFLSTLCLLCLPESPGFLASNARYSKLEKTLTRISNCNCRRFTHSQNSYCNRDEQVIDEQKCETYSMLSNSSFTRHNKVIKKHVIKLCSSTATLFKLPHLINTIVLILVSFCLAFGSYGLYMWFPEYFKYLESNNCTSDDDNCTSTTSNIYRDSFFTSLANIPCIILGLLCVKCLGAKVVLSFAMVLSGVSSLSIWAIPKEATSVVILSCIFTGFCTMCWTVLDAIIPELFPVHLRSTSFGLLSAVGRIGSIIGILLFGRLITVSYYLPILVVASVLITGGLAMLLMTVKKALTRRRSQYLVMKNNNHYEEIN